jgi:hypothetical protein
LPFFVACSLSALTPIGVVHELLQHAIELSAGRMLVLTPQRLALLNSAADTQIRDSYWSTSPQLYRGFTVHDSHAFLPAQRNIRIVRIGETLEEVGVVDIDYAWGAPPIIADGHLDAIRGQRELHIFSLAVPQASVP